MPIVIDLQVANKQTDSVLDKLTKALDRLDKVQQSLNDALRQTAANANQAASSFNRMGSAASRARTATGARGTNWTSYYSAIAEQNPRAALNYASTMLQGDPYNAGLIRLQQRAQRALNAQSPAHILGQAFMRSRWMNVAGKLVGSPLGIDLSKMIRHFGPMAASQFFGGVGGGAGGAAGAGGAVAGLAGAAPAIGAVAGLAATIIGLSQAAKLASSSLAPLIAGVATGGSMKTEERLRSYEIALGMQPGGLASAAKAGMSSGYGSGYYAGLGVNPVTGPFGNMDYSGAARKALGDIMGARSFQEARRKAELAGMPEAAKFYYLSGPNKANLNARINTGGGAYEMASQVNYEYTKARLETAWLKLMEKLTPLMNAFASILDMLGKFLDVVNYLLTGKSPESQAKQKAEREWADAAKQHARAMKDWETLGGGARASGSVPGGYRNRGFQLDGARMHDIRLGAV